MAANMETWSAGAGEVYVYTDSLEVHKELLRFNDRFATYERGGRAYAWQHRIARCALVSLERRFALKRSLKTKGLQVLPNHILPMQGDLFEGGSLVEVKPQRDSDSKAA